MSALFPYAREFNPDGLQSIFGGTVPNGVGGEELKAYRRLFGNTCVECLHHFMMRAELYEVQDPDTGKSWVEHRHAEGLVAARSQWLRTRLAWNTSGHSVASSVFPGLYELHRLLVHCPADEDEYKMAFAWISQSQDRMERSGMQGCRPSPWS